MVLAFDGLPHRFTTSDDPDGVDTGFNDGDVLGGLHITGEISQRIDPFEPRVEPDSLTFTITDVGDGVLRNLLFAPALSSGTKTFLTANFDANDTTANVVDTTAWNSSGIFYVGHETVTYGGKTGTTFTGCTRGVNSLFTTNGGTQYSTAHNLRTGEAAGNATAPIVTDYPRVFYNRCVALYLCHKESAWSSKANSKMLWVGRIKSYEDVGDGNVVLQCTSIMEALNSTVMTEQFTAKPDLLFQIPSGMSMRVGAYSTTDYDTGAAAVPNIGSYVNVDGLISSINEQLSFWHDAGDIDAGHLWEVSRVNNFVRITMSAVSPIADSVVQGFAMSLSRKLWRLLGYSIKPRLPWEESETDREHKLLNKASTSRWELVAETPVAAYAWLPALNPGDVFTVTDTTGTWVPQPSVPAGYGSSTEGFLQLDKQPMPVTYDAGNKRFTVKQLKGSGAGTFSDVADLNAADAEPQVLKQVWLERGKAGTLLLQLLLSSGVSTFNHATYDVYTGIGMGMAVPASLIDIESFETLDLSFELLMAEPTSFAKLLERLMACSGRSLVWKDSKITLVSPGSESPNATTTIDCTEDTKAKPRDRPRLKYTTEGLINRVVLKYGSSDTMAVDVLKVKGPSELTVEMSHSITDFGHKRTVELDGTGVLDERSVIESSIAPTLAYYSQPTGRIELSYNAKLSHICPGDTITVTDNAIIDPALGTRGVTNVGAFVTETNFDWKSGHGVLQAMLLPGLPQARYAVYSPSARVDDTQANGGLSNADKTLTCYAHGYSRSTDTAADASWIAAGDLVHVVQLSPSNPAAPVEWYRTVDTVVGNAVTLTVALSSPSWDPALKYVIEYDDKSTVQASQRSNAFIADDADGSTGYAANDHNAWSSANNTWINKYGAHTYATSYIKPVTAAYAEGEPLSVHKIWNLYDNLSNLLNYKTRAVYLSEPGAIPAETQAGTTYRLVYGPILVPVMGASSIGSASECRLMRAKMFMARTAGAGNAQARLTSANRMVTGTADDSLTFPGTKVQTVFTSTSATYEWTAEQTFAPALFFSNGQAFTYLSVEITGSTGATTAGFKGAWCVEEPLS